MCRTNIIFGTLKDSSLKINRLQLNNCFSCRNFMQNGVNALSKIAFKNSVSYQKTQFFVHFQPYDSVQISPAGGLSTYKNKGCRIPVSAFVTVALKSFNGKFTAKIAFPIGHFMLPLLTLQVFGPHAGEIWIKSYSKIYTKFWAFWIIEKMSTPFWKTFLWQTLLFDGKALNERVSSFFVLYNMIIRHV